MIDNFKLQAKGDTIGVRPNNVEMKSKVRDSWTFMCIVINQVTANKSRPAVNKCTTMSRCRKHSTVY